MLWDVRNWPSHDLSIGTECTFFQAHLSTSWRWSNVRIRSRVTLSLFETSVCSLCFLSPESVSLLFAKNPFFFNFQFLGTVSHVGSHKIGWNLVSVAFNYVLLLPAMLFNAKVLPSQLLLCQWYLEQGMRLAGTPHSWLKKWTLYFLAFLKLISWCSEISQYFERVSWKFCHMVSSLLSFVFILFKERNNLFSLVWLGKHKGWWEDKDQLRGKDFRQQALRKDSLLVYLKTDLWGCSTTIPTHWTLGLIRPTLPPQPTETFKFPWPNIPWKTSSP